ncbi:MAG TPA: ABC transporter permease [Steroidobacteraceae bacterium]|nr:ABC transporter permease [Steroidobacteraceae bacterium]
MLRFLPLVWTGIWRRPGRTTLALVQILLAFALFGILQGWQSGVSSAIAHIDADLLSVHPRGGFGALPRADFDAIRQVPGVRMVNLANYFMATYQNPDQHILVIATLPRNWAQITHDVIVAPAAVAALEHARTGAIVGDALMRKYGWKVGQKLPVQSRVAQRNGSTDWTFDIVGVLRMKDADARSHSTFIVINNDYYDDARALDRGMVSQYLLRVNDPKQADEVAAAIDRKFDNSTYETRTEPMREMAQQSMSSIGDINLVIRAIVGAVLFSLLFSIGALLMQSVRERSGELAVLKAIGFSDRTVMSLLVTEATLLCLVSAALGLALAWTLFWIAERMNFWPLHIQLSAPVLARGAALALLLAAASALLPALRGLRLPVARAMAGG